MPSIRAARPPDAPAVRRVAAATWRDAYPFITEATVEAELDHWYDPDRVRDAVADPESVYLVAVGGDEAGDGDAGGLDRPVADPAAAEAVLGYAKAWPGEPAELSTLYVHPEAQGLGLGARLLDAACVRLRRQGCERVRLSAFAENEAGRAFYREQGFEQVGRGTVELVDGTSFPEVYFARSLAP